MVRIIRGNFIKQSADAMINPINADIIFDKGIPFLVKKNGGDRIEKESFKYYPARLGDVFITDGGGLAAKHIIHLVNRSLPAHFLPGFNVCSGEGAVFVLKLDLNPWPFPIYNRFSPEITNIICDAIKESIAQKPETADLDISVVIYDKDACDLFYRVFQSQMEGVVLES